MSSPSRSTSSTRWPAFGELDGEYGGLVSPEDIEFRRSPAEPDSSAALLHLGGPVGGSFAAAVRNSGGVVGSGARIPHELIEPAFSALPWAV